ncbi:arginase family protein [Lentimicrobium sp.]|uniref:arginase family protein n=1 Tax=Lentimicrobium sp. TaxID=2034841 RepID=UPI0025EF6178|nr:arginase family protein [Lentimicrobium sp.]MCO5258322.1 arginase family protein [Lentimicrobium sp.]MCO5262560.1 arginase family protein [Lentimicrobium sp.]HPR26442.1 arginase family protein [Lentimicrobium sp.]
MKQKQFGSLPAQLSNYETAKFVILPVPFEGPGHVFKGSDKGPEALIDASASINLYDIHTDTEAYKAGIHTAEAVRERSPEKMVKEVQVRTLQLLKKRKFPVIVGGEHTAAIGAIRAFADYYKDKDLTILQFDAHTARCSEEGGTAFHHHCVMKHAAALAPILQAGIRSMSLAEREVLEPGRIFYAESMLDGSNKTWMYDFLNKLSRNVFITIDLDVLDPSLMPAVATPEPGGLQWAGFVEILTKVNEKSNIAGVCIAGLVPIKYNKAPNFIAARLLNTILTLRNTSELK